MWYNVYMAPLKPTWYSLYESKHTPESASKVMRCSLRTATKNLEHQRNKHIRKWQNTEIGRLWGQQTLQIEDGRRPLYDYAEIGKVVGLTPVEVHQRIEQIAQRLFNCTATESQSQGRVLTELRRFEKALIAEQCGAVLSRQKVVPVEYAALFSGTGHTPQDIDVYDITTSCLRYMAESGTQGLKRKVLDRVKDTRCDSVVC